MWLWLTNVPSTMSNIWPTVGYCNLGSTALAERCLDHTASPFLEVNKFKIEFVFLFVVSLQQPKETKRTNLSEGVS